MQPPRSPVDDEVNRDPETDDEVPICGVLLGVLEALPLDERGEEHYSEHDGVDQIGEEMQDVQPHQSPDCRAVSIDAPVCIQVPELEVADNHVADAEEREDNETDPHCPQIAFSRTTTAPLVGQDTNEEEAQIHRSPKEVRRIAVRGPL